MADVTEAMVEIFDRKIPSSPHSEKKKFLEEHQHLEPIPSTRGTDFPGFPQLPNNLRTFLNPEILLIKLMKNCDILKKVKICASYNTIYETLQSVNFLIAGISKNCQNYLRFILAFLDAPLAKSKTKKKNKNCKISKLYFFMKKKDVIHKGILAN